MDEALRGLSIRVSNAFLPIFVESAEAIANWFAANQKTISKWVSDAARIFQSLQNDVVLLFGSGASQPRFENSWMASFFGPAQQLKSIIEDLVDIVMGGSATRNPWLNDLGTTAAEAWTTLQAIVGEIAELVSWSERPSLAKMFQDASTALQSFRDGLNGEIGEMPWASNIAMAATEIGSALVSLANIVNDNKDTLADFAATTLGLVADGMEAIRNVIAGKEVDADSAFSWLPGVVKMVGDAFTNIIAGLQAVWDFVLTQAEALRGVFEFVTGIMDGIAKMLGLPGWESLGIILLIAHLTGALAILDHLTGIFSEIIVFANNLLGAVGNIVKAGQWLVVTLLPLATSIATALSIPVWAVFAIGAAVVAALIAIVIAIVIYWDEIVAAFTAGWKWVSEATMATMKFLDEAFRAMADAVVGAWNSVVEAAVAAWDAVVAAWNGAIQWFKDLGQSIADIWNGFWGAIGDGAKAAWDSVTGIFSGFVDFFADPIGKVGDMFKGLWDGIKNGAIGAWESVKSFFGFGGDEQSANGSVPSYDVGTRRVPGADGQGMLARVHGGERILRVDQNKRWGGLLDSLEGLTTLPVSPFSMGPTAMPTGGGSGSSMQPANLDLNGRRYRLQGEPMSVRALKSGLARHARMMAGPAPRWRTT